MTADGADRRAEHQLVARGQRLDLGQGLQHGTRNGEVIAQQLQRCRRNVGRVERLLFEVAISDLVGRPPLGEAEA
ncbi:hypothetical protein D3C87_2081760 [compost metagenome]